MDASARSPESRLSKRQFGLGVARFKRTIQLGCGASTGGCGASKRFARMREENHLVAPKRNPERTLSFEDRWFRLALQVHATHES